MRHRRYGRRPSAIVIATAVAFGAWCIAGSSTSAAPQEAGLIGESKPGAKGAAKGAAADAEKVSTAKTPKRPDSPPDNSVLAPPLPGYALMFILGGAIVALNLWSSKRTQLD